MKIFNYVIDIDLNARWPLTYTKLYKHSLCKQFVWWKLSILWGQPHLEEIRVCDYCNNEVREVSFGDEGVTHCEECDQIEGPTTYITIEEYERIHI